MADTIAIRPARQDDLPGILAVLKRALGETPLLQRTPELWRWKHVLNPFGPSLVLVAEAEERIVGVRALMRWELSTGDGMLLRCVRAVDTATDPDFGRRGVFRRLTMEALDLARSEGVDLVFNTPNAQSGPGYLKMGWREVGPIGVMVRPRIRRGGQVTHLPSPEQAVLDPAPVELLASRPPGARLRTRRSPDYLRWRFQQHPTARFVGVGHEGGVAVVRPNLRRGRSELVLSDLLGTPSPSLVREVARRSRTSYVATWFSPHTPERRAALLGGMLPLPGFRALTLVAYPLQALEIDVYDIRNWDLATSDLELL